VKTRIIYPTLWADPKIQELNKTGKFLFMYLISNPYLGLTRYSQISDKQIAFDTDLSQSEITKAKKDLTDKGLVFFYQHWQFHNHELSYVDYTGRDRVLDAKTKEIELIPQEIKEVFNGLVTGCKPVLNHKSKTLNPKPETNGINTNSVARELTPQQKLIAYCRELQGIEQEFLNYGKQTKAVSIITKSYSHDDIRFVMEEMAKEAYWQENPFDLQNVANNMHKYMNRTVMFNQKGKYGR
jgi:hypothetical protein